MKKYYRPTTVFYFFLFVAVFGPFSPIVGVEMCVGGYFPTLVGYLQPVFNLCYGIIPFSFMFIVPFFAVPASIYIILYGKYYWKFIGTLLLFINLIVCTLIRFHVL
jgi:hypothetical protein